MAGNMVMGSGHCIGVPYSAGLAYETTA
jgi:hypothetical protein